MGKSCCPLRCDWRAEVYALMERGAAARATGATKLNEISSRSHGGFRRVVGTVGFFVLLGYAAAGMTCLGAVSACPSLSTSCSAVPAEPPFSFASPIAAIFMLIVEKSTPLDGASGDGGQAGMAPGVCLHVAADVCFLHVAALGEMAACGCLSCPPVPLSTCRHGPGLLLRPRDAAERQGADVSSSLHVWPGKTGRCPHAPCLAAPRAATRVAAAPSPTRQVGKLNLVDLAGSERVHVTGATGKRLEESKKINQVGGW